MKRKLALAVVAVVATPGVFAQSATVEASTTTTTISTTMASPITQRALRNGAIAEMPVVDVAVAPTAVLGAPAAAPATVVRYFFNVPQDIQGRADFRRWQRLL